MSNASPPLEITCRDVQAKLASGAAFLFLDCREPNEAEVAAIAGTKLIPMSQIAERASELEPHRD